MSVRTFGQPTNCETNMKDTPGRTRRTFLKAIVRTVFQRGSRTRSSILRLCSPTQPRMEVPHATASQCTVNTESNQETTTKIYRSSVGALAHASWTRDLSEYESIQF